MKLLFICNVDWFFKSHRLAFALAAQSIGFQVHIATSITTCEKLFISYGFHVHQVDFKRSSQNPILLTVNFFRILYLYLRLRPQVVHLVTIQPVILGGLAARIVGQKNIVFAVSGLGHVFTSLSFFGRCRKKLILVFYRISLSVRSKRIIFQNCDDRNCLDSVCHFDPHQIRMIPGCGVDLDFFYFSKAPTTPLVVTMASRLLRTKGVIEFFQAAHYLYLKNTNIKFQIVGESDIENPASLTPKDIESMSSSPFIEFLGHRDDLNDIFAHSSIIVLPSYLEGFPKVLCEASASGRAIITTDVPGCRDVIDPGITGILVQPRNFIALAEGIEYLSNNIELIEKFGLNARRKAEESFDLNLITCQHLLIYSELTSL